MPALDESIAVGLSGKLYAIRIFCFDWRQAFEIYKETLALPVYFADDNLGWAPFELGGSYIGLERCDADDAQSSDLVGRFVGISIQVDDIQQTYEVLSAKGVKFTGEPHQLPWGGTLAHFADSENNI